MFMDWKAEHSWDPSAQWIYRFGAIPPGIPAGSFAELQVGPDIHNCTSRDLRQPNHPEKGEQSWKTHFPISKFTTKRQ